MPHTPGPWKVVEHTAQQSSVYATERYHPVCTLDIEEGDSGGVEADANARLIAAAPDLLAACEEALAFLRQTVSTNVRGKPEEITIEELCGLSGGGFVARVLTEALEKVKAS